MDHHHLDYRLYFWRIARSWPLILACVVLAGLGAWGLLARSDAEYVSSGTLFVNTPVSETGAAGAYQGTLFAQQRVASYADVIESDLLAGRVIEAENLAAEPGQLVGKISARVVPNTVLLDLVVTDTSPQGAQDLAIAYTKAFVELLPELERPPSGEDSLVSVTVLNSPDLPSSPVSPRPVRILTLAVTLGVIAGVGLAILRETFDTTIRTTQRLAEITDSSNLGTIPYERDVRENQLSLLTAPRSNIAEAFRQLGTNLQLVAQSEPKVFVVTSSVPLEGKSTTTVNLAHSLVEAGLRVIVLEADLRRPHLADYLGLAADRGLVDVLTGAIEIDQALQTYGGAGRHQWSNLQVMVGGTVPPSPSELLQTGAMADLLSSLRTRADVVLVDSPPLLPVADTRILANVADGILLVVRHGYTTTGEVQEAIAAMETIGTWMVGTVFTMAPAGLFRGNQYHYRDEGADRAVRASAPHGKYVAVGTAVTAWRSFWRWPRWFAFTGRLIRQIRAWALNKRILLMSM